MSEMTYKKLKQATEVFEKHGMTAEEITKSWQSQIDNSFWEGFDACLEMVINSLDNQESNEIAKMSVWEFIEDFKQNLHEEYDLYRKDG